MLWLLIATTHLKYEEKQRLHQHNSGAFSARQRVQHDKAHGERLDTTSKLATRC